ncbi:archaemetzincin [Flavobacterium sp. SUN052]|uniref:archaemetzincin n=1 Tax=Flavobacterium sp. SUN052 TaxID=3002441 RepID=UPI00237D818A|nr:archaemetzincin [Flavobacterium sp. SUN052]MEC4003753.1 archaemetzincin [Flavobacterium sp. SUN052]
MKRLCFLLSFLILIGCTTSNTKTELDKLAILDVKLSVPKAGEWMAEHHEDGQSFEKYVANNPVTISDAQKVIYIQPIGNFNYAEKEIVVSSVAYISLFFKLKTVLLNPISENAIPSDKKRINNGIEQLDASYINSKILPNKIPADGIVIMAITAKDLYPSEDWNYVFGLANYDKRTGISSFNRFVENGDYELCLNRTIKTAVHEIGHMFSMNHCKHAVCLMNGVNHLPESDTKPNALCSDCLKKLSWNLKFDNKNRLENLIIFLKKHHFNADAAILQQQLSLLKEK